MAAVMTVDAAARSDIIHTSHTVDSQDNAAKAASATATEEEDDYRLKYKNLKRKLRVLCSEQQVIVDALDESRRKVARLARERIFLLDRLMKFELPADTSGSDEGAMVEDEMEITVAERQVDVLRSLLESKTKGLENKTASSDKGNGSAPAGSLAALKSKLLKEKKTIVKTSGTNGGSTTGIVSGPKASIDTGNLVCTYVGLDGIQCTRDIPLKSRSGMCRSHRTLISNTKKKMSPAPPMLGSLSPGSIGDDLGPMYGAPTSPSLVRPRVNVAPGIGNSNNSGVLMMGGSSNSAPLRMAKPVAAPQPLPTARLNIPLFVTPPVRAVHHNGGAQSAVIGEATDDDGDDDGDGSGDSGSGSGSDSDDGSDDDDEDSDDAPCDDDDEINDEDAVDEEDDEIGI